MEVIKHKKPYEKQKRIFKRLKIQVCFPERTILKKQNQKADLTESLRVKLKNFS